MWMTSVTTGNLLKLIWEKNWIWLNITSQFSEETSVNTKVEGIVLDGEGTRCFWRIVSEFMETSGPSGVRRNEGNADGAQLCAERSTVFHVCWNKTFLMFKCKCWMVISCFKV